FVFFHISTFLRIKLQSISTLFPYTTLFRSYPSIKLDRIIVTGGASILPEFPLYLANKFGVNVEIGNAWRNVAFPADRQNELLAVSNHFGVAAGLAERAE